MGGNFSRSQFISSTDRHGNSFSSTRPFDSGTIFESGDYLQEEKLRTGENGPAGAAALKPSPDRFLPPPSALEHALRDSLFQIAQEEERSHHVELRNEQLLKSTQEMLLECSQAANTARPDVGVLDTKSIGVQGWHSDEDGNSSGEKARSQDELVDEHVIRSQPPRSSQVKNVICSCNLFSNQYHVRLR